MRGVGAIRQADCIVIGEGVLESVWQRISTASTVGLEVALELLSAKAFRRSYFILTGGLQQNLRWLHSLMTTGYTGLAVP